MRAGDIVETTAEYKRCLETQQPFVGVIIKNHSGSVVEVSTENRGRVFISKAWLQAHKPKICCVQHRCCCCCRAKDEQRREATVVRFAQRRLRRRLQAKVTLARDTLKEAEGTLHRFDVGNNF